MPTPASSKPWRNGTWPVWPKRLLPVLDARDIDVVERVNRWWPGLPCAGPALGQGALVPGLAAEEWTTAPWRTTSCSCCRGKGTSRWRFLSGRHHGAGCRTARPVPDGSARRSDLHGWRWRQRIARREGPTGLRRNGVVDQSFGSRAITRWRRRCRCRGQADLGPFERLLAVRWGGRMRRWSPRRPFTLPPRPSGNCSPPHLLRHLIRVPNDF